MQSREKWKSKNIDPHNREKWHTENDFLNKIKEEK